MPSLETAHFGVLDYAAEDVIQFPQGLPAFESETEFLAIEQPGMAPVVFLQSVRTPQLAFTTLPARKILDSFRLLASPEDLTTLGLDPESPPDEKSAQVLSLAIVTVNGSEPATANLMAPV